MSRELTIENTGLPVGWEMKKLLEISTVLTGKHNANHSKNDGKYRFYTCAYDHLFCDTKRFKGECLVLPGNGVNVGEVFYFDGEFDAYQRTYVIFNIKINVRYLHYHMLLYWRELGTKLQYGSATNFIKIGNFQDYKVSLAPLPQQKQIVTTLDKAFAAIDTAKANAEQNLKNSKELFESYLQNVFKNKGDDWEEKKIEDLSNDKKAIVSGPFGSNLKVSDYKDEGVPLIRLQNIGKGHFIDKSIKYVSHVKAEELKSHSFKTGDIVLAKLGIPIGKTCIIPEYFGAGIIVADIVRIRPNAQLYDYKFVEYYLNADISVSQLTNNISGATRPRVNLSDVRNIVISLPSISEQKKIVSQLEVLETKTNGLQLNYTQKIAGLEEMKKSVLQKAFSGQLNTVN